MAGTAALQAERIRDLQHVRAVLATVAICASATTLIVLTTPGFNTSAASSIATARSSLICPVARYARGWSWLSRRPSSVDGTARAPKPVPAQGNTANSGFESNAFQVFVDGVQEGPAELIQLAGAGVGTSRRAIRDHNARCSTRQTCLAGTRRRPRGRSAVASAWRNPRVWPTAGAPGPTATGARAPASAYATVGADIRVGAPTTQSTTGTDVVERHSGVRLGRSTSAVALVPSRGNLTTGGAPRRSARTTCGL